MKGEDIKKRFEALWTQRKTVEQTWDLIEQFIMPIRGGKFFENQQSEHEIDWRRGRQVFDSTAQNACYTLASSMHGALTSPSVRWFGLRARTTELNEKTEVVQWLERSADAIFHALQDSNFNLEVNEGYLDLAGFGTAIIFEEPVADTTWEGLDFSAIPVREGYFEMDHRRQVLRFYRLLQWTPVQIVSKFGKDVPDDIKQKAENAQAVDEKIDIIFCVYPRDNVKDSTWAKKLAPKKRKYGYKYIMRKDGEMIGKEGGYYEMPAYVPRWQKASGSQWGFSPSTIALSDVMTLNALVELILQALEKVVDPANLTTERGLISDLDLGAAGLTVVRNIDDLVPYESKANFNASTLLVEDLRNRIRQTFLVDQLELKESPAMSATEVNARVDLMQRLLGPVLGRLTSDFLDPMIERTFRILWRNGVIESPPEVMGNSEFDVEYTGPMARAQRTDTVMAIEGYLNSVAALGEMFPKMQRLVDEEKTGRILAGLRGAPVAILKNEAEFEQSEKDLEAAQAAAAKAAQNQATGDGMKALGEGASAVESAGASPDDVTAMQ